MNKIGRTCNVCLLSFVLIISIGISVYTSYGASNTMTADKGTMTVSTDSQYLYINFAGTWDYNINESIAVSVNGTPVTGANGSIVLNCGNNVESQSLQVKNAWYGDIAGAEGSVVNIGYADGRYETVTWQIKVPLSVYGNNVSTLELGWSGQTVSVAVAGSSVTTEETTETTEETVTTEEPDQTEDTTEEIVTTEEVPEDSGVGEDIHVTSSLVIDGYYADWNAYPVTNITYTSNNGTSVHKGQIYTDGTMVYVHFAMNDLYTSQVMTQQMTITINGESHTIGLYPLLADKSIDWSYPMYSLPEGIHTNYGVIVDYTKYCDSQAAITIYDATHQPDTKGDEVEFAFNLEDFARITGMKTDNVGNITIVNPNIGAQGITWVGTSTAPWLGAAVAVLLAGVGVAAYKCNKGKKI